MTIAYARVSTTERLLDRQLDMLKQHGYDEIFTEKYTGTKAYRPEFDDERASICINNIKDATRTEADTTAQKIYIKNLKKVAIILSLAGLIIISIILIYLSYN